MMPGEVITDPGQVTVDWLTAVLTRSGALTSGAVTTIRPTTGHGNWSTNAALEVQYTDDAQGELPRRLFLKMVQTDSGDETFGPSEVTYYTRDYVDVADAPLVRCYDGAYSAAIRRYHLLLDDLSETHTEAYNKTPTLGYGLALAEGFAALHGRWWGAARLAEVDEPIHSADHIQRFVDIAAPGADYILAQFSHELEPHWPDLVRSLYAHHPQRLIARTQNDNGFTLIHGDAGPYNILVPREGERPIYLIDRQPFDWSLTTWLGVYDLVYALVIDWETDLRRSLELPILKHYYHCLRQRGIKGYTWEQLWADYRLMAPLGVYIATEFCRGGINEPMRWVWLPMLQRALTACDDLNCRSLWETG
ncbi:MAG: hypothetical protein KBE23_00725 [Chloroflexi bacterium]|nr:hypothetical protein [Chloroflexota bacterium]MBP7041237.1 hypothetical protein [Chloroflexota bacterium]